MAKEIRWTERALTDFENVLNYLNKNWSAKELNSFIIKTEQLTGLISQNPFLFRKTGSKNLREALITKHNLLVYQVKKEKIFILTVWDTRMHPVKKKINNYF